MKKVQRENEKMSEITGAQMRAARALLQWTAAQLAATAGVGLSTIRRAEAEDETAPITAASLKIIRVALENAGIEFIPENGGGEGVRFKKHEDDG